MKSLLLLSVALAVHTSAAADTAALQRCRSLPDPAARLGCYDAITLPAAVPAGGVTPPVAPGGAAVAAPAVAAVAKPAPAADPQATFGLEQRKLPAPEADVLTSAIPGRFEGWRANERFHLANGQVWQISDGSEAAYSLQDPAVRVTRGVAGTFFMEITGVSQTPRVRRIQ